MGQIIVGIKLFACLLQSPVEAHKETQSTAVALGEASALLAELSGKPGSLARALAIHLDNYEDACGRRAAERANKKLLATKGETFMRIPLKERELSTRVGKVIVQLVLCSNSVNLFNVQGNACRSRTGQPVAPRYSLPHLAAARLPACRCGPGATSSLLGAWSRCGRGRAEAGEGTAHFQNHWAEDLRGRGRKSGWGGPYAPSCLTAVSEAPCCSLPCACTQRCNIKVTPMRYQPSFLFQARFKLFTCSTAMTEPAVRRCLVRPF